MEDRRKSQRFEYFLELRYAPRDAERSFSYTISKNISQDGICMPVLSRSAEKGDVLKLDIKPHDDKGPVTVIGKVKWVKKITRPAQLELEIGLEFTETTPKDIKRLLTP